MRAYCSSEALNPIRFYSYKKSQRHTGKRWSHDKGSRDWSMNLQGSVVVLSAKCCQQTPEARKRHGRMIS